jgi:hypothetical protein
MPEMRLMTLRRRKFALRFAGYSLAAWIMVAWLSMNYFGFTRPKHPVPAEGRLYPFRDHYTVVFLTPLEHRMVDSYWWAFGALALVIFLQRNSQADDKRGKSN